MKLDVYSIKTGFSEVIDARTWVTREGATLAQQAAIFAMAPGDGVEVTSPRGADFIVYCADPVVAWEAKDGNWVSSGEEVETISGKVATVRSIDAHGYASLFGEVSKVYIPNLPQRLS